VVERLGVEATGEGGVLKLENAEDDCTATVYVDGAPTEVGPGGKAEVTLASGRGVVEWQERSGDFRFGFAAPGSTAKVGCEPGPMVPTKLSETVPTPVPTQPEAAPVDAEIVRTEEPSGGAVEAPPDAAAEKPYGVEPAQLPYIGAAAAMVFYLELWSIALDGKPLEAQPRSLYRLLLKTLANRPRHDWDSLGQYIPIIDNLHAALGKAKGDKEKMKRIERIAAILLVQTGQLSTPCAKIDLATATKEQRDEHADCVLRKATTDAKDKVAIGLIRVAKAQPPTGWVVDELTEMAK
jgi:hypothetical protein